MQTYLLTFLFFSILLLSACGSPSENQIYEDLYTEVYNELDDYIYQYYYSSPSDFELEFPTEGFMEIDNPEKGVYLVRAPIYVHDIWTRETLDFEFILLYDGRDLEDYHWNYNLR